MITLKDFLWRRFKYWPKTTKFCLVKWFWQNSELEIFTRAISSFQELFVNKIWPELKLLEEKIQKKSIFAHSPCKIRAKELLWSIERLCQIGSFTEICFRLLFAKQQTNLGKEISQLQNTNNKLATYDMKNFSVFLVQATVICIVYTVPYI